MINIFHIFIRHISSFAVSLFKHLFTYWIDDFMCLNFPTQIITFLQCLWKISAIILTSFSLSLFSFFLLFSETCSHCSPCSPWILEIFLSQPLACLHCRCLSLFFVLSIASPDVKVLQLIISHCGYCSSSPNKSSISRSWKTFSLSL